MALTFIVGEESPDSRIDGVSWSVEFRFNASGRFASLIYQVMQSQLEQQWRIGWRRVKRLSFRVLLIYLLFIIRGNPPSCNWRASPHYGSVPYSICILGYKL